MERLTENTEYQKERLRVLIALGVQEQSPPGDCPSDEQIAAFADGQLKNDERKMILAHLNACPSCYRQWLDISFFTITDTKALQESYSSDLPVIETVTKKMQKIIPSFRLSSAWWERLSIGFAVAAAACLLLFMMTPIPLEIQITRSYQSALVQKPAFKAGEEQAQALGLPWEKAERHFAFGTSPRHDPEYRAFGAGLWSGRQAFSGVRQTYPMPAMLSPKWKNSPTDADHWSETRYGIYYTMGRWCFLLRAICLSDSRFSQNFWEEQRTISDRIEKDFISAEKSDSTRFRIVKERLRNIQSALNASVQESPSRKQRRKAARELAMLTDYLSPSLTIDN